MPREITAPTPAILTSKSADGKHVLQFNEGSHRYKLDGKAAVGVTTFIKAGYPTSMGLIQWMKGQSIQYVWDKLTIQSPSHMMYANSFTQMNEEDRIQLFKDAKAADQKTSQEAADIGTLVHDYAYMTEIGKIQDAEKLFTQIKELKVAEKIINGINKFKAWKKDNVDELVASESIVASPTHLFCGKFDRLARRNGRLILGDFKTSGDIYLDQFIQLGAYRIAIREWLGLNVDGFEVLRFGKDDGEFETLLIDKPEEVQLFEEQAVRCRQTHEFRKLEQDERWDWKKK